MSPGFVDRLYQFLDSLHASSLYDSEESQLRLSMIRRTLQEKRSLIEASPDPFVEGLSTVLSVARNQDDINLASGICTPPMSEHCASVNGVSQMMELMRNQIDAVAGAQIQALSRQPSIAPQFQHNTGTQCESLNASLGLSSSHLGSSPQSECGNSVEPGELSANRSHEPSQAEPFPIDIGTSPLSHRPSQSEPIQQVNPDVTLEYDQAIHDVAQDELLQDGPKPRFYRPLSSLSGEVALVNVYVVAIEMIRASVRNLVTQRDLMNYRAVDPSICEGIGSSSAGFSIQILAPNDSKQIHVNFGDIIRLKRANAQIRYDKLGNKHMNILMTLKNQPSMRIWPNKDVMGFSNGSDSAEADKSTLNGGGQDATADLNTLESEAIVIYGGNKTRVDEEDLSIVTKLRQWVKKLDPMKMTTNPEFLRTIAESGSYANDCIVCVLEVCPEPQVNLVVSDASSVAVVLGLTEILISNVLESQNCLMPGDWIKLRYVQRMSKPFQRADGSNYIVLMASSFSCVTRLPRLNLPYKKPIPADSPMSKKARRMTRMKMWNSASGLNPSFPRHLFGSTGYVDRLLEHNGDKEGEFEKVPTCTVGEFEEGEIQLQ